jgi:hypothetical protein
VPVPESRRRVAAAQAGRDAGGSPSGCLTVRPVARGRDHGPSRRRDGRHRRQESPSPERRRARVVRGTGRAIECGPGRAAHGDRGLFGCRAARAHVRSTSPT